MGREICTSDKGIAGARRGDETMGGSVRRRDEAMGGSVRTGDGAIAGNAVGDVKRADAAAWLRGEYPGGDAALFAAAREVMEREVGRAVHLRGLLEFSNRCRCDCRYCGIRRRAAVTRFDLSEEEIAAAARFCRDQGFGSMTIQSGERRDTGFVNFVERVLRRIKAETRTTHLPHGLGITLCVGEQSAEVYRRFFDAGAHRYLLRIETSDPALFARLHPVEQRWEERVEALHTLKQIGYQVGTGVMIGIPGQTEDDLARDVAFFRSVDADMIGMGPYIPSRVAEDAENAHAANAHAANTDASNAYAAGTGGIARYAERGQPQAERGQPRAERGQPRAEGGQPRAERGQPRAERVDSGAWELSADRSDRERLRLSLRMVAVTRIILRDVNIAATTALQALSATGREAALACGANVLMPIVTPHGERERYQLYDGKPCVEETDEACSACVPARAAWAKRPVSRNAWGDAPHAVGTRNLPVGDRCADRRRGGDHERC